MQKYLTFFYLYWQSILAYRFDTTVYALTGLITPFLGLFIWLSVKSENQALSFNLSEIIFYFLAVAWCSNVTTAWSAYFISDDIKTGKILGYMAKPFSPLENAAMNNLAEKTFKLSIVTLAVVLGWILFSLHYSLTLPIVYPLIPLSLIALLCGMTLMILFDVCMGLAAFWLPETDFLINFYFMMDTLLTGRIIPLNFLPPFLQSISPYLPFRYIISFPIEIVMGKLSGIDLIKGFILLIIWTIFFWVLQKLLYAKGTKNYQSFGG